MAPHEVGAQHRRDGVKGQGRPQGAKSGKAFRAGEDRSHNVDYSYQAQGQKQDTQNELNPSHDAPPLVIEPR